jgi:type I restriction enzyme S subunit
MNKMKAWQGSYGVSPHTGIVSPAYYVFGFSVSMHPDFFHRAIRSKLYVSFFGQASDGVRIGQWDLSKPRMKAIPFFLPSLPEQTAIANFLDEKTAKIDTAIAQKQQMISLLKERKQILIQHAVTKGINPDAKMKDSGVEWIGEIPEGWDMKSGGLIAQIVRGASPRPAGHPLYFGSSDVNWITVGDITKDENLYLTKPNCYLTNAGKSHSRYIPKGTFILSNSGATLGVPKIMAIDGCINDGVLAFLNFKDQIINKHFFYFYLSAQTTRLRDELNQGATQPNLNTDLVKRLPITVPPLPVQQEIVEFIETQSAKIDTSISLQQQQIAKLKEYKSTLIDSAVTGKIKVG